MLRALPDEFVLYVPEVRDTRELNELARKLPGDEALRNELRATLNAIKYHKKVLAEL